MGRALRAGRGAGAAACVVLAACAGEPVAPPAALDFRPAARSTLVSNREGVFLVAQQRGGAELTTVLAHRLGDAVPHPVARLVQVGVGAASRISVQPLPQAANAAGRAGRRLAALEQLYALVLRLEPLARYCLGSGGRPCDTEQEGLSHAQVLRALADARDRAADRTAQVVPWRVIEMKGMATRTWDADVVGVLATSGELPLAGVAIYFNRAPHSLCVARTREDGAAICRLVDQHGDAHEHDHTAPVVATFPGDVQTDRVLLPSTYVLPAFVAPRMTDVLPVKP